MRRFASVILSALILTVAFVGTSNAVDYESEYILTIGEYYNVSYEDVHDVVLAGVEIEEIPVVFFIAQKSKSSAIDIATARLNGQSWDDIAHLYELNGASFNVIIAGKFKSATFVPIFEKYRTTPQSEWKNIVFSDNDIVNLVNLKMLYSFHDYSPFQVIGMRDFQKSYPRINNQVAYAKRRMHERRVAQLSAENSNQNQKVAPITPSLPVEPTDN